MSNHTAGGDTTPPLSPMSLGTLLGRIEHEWTTRKKIFDLPNARIWKPDPEVDLGFDFLGRRCATPIGPAAGPHSQLAQNIVLAWLGGSRLFELKTVQIIDDLVISRPCIDMQTIGYNIEWSQELTVSQSLTEYVKASMLLEILQRWEPLAEFVSQASPPPGALPPETPPPGALPPESPEVNGSGALPPETPPPGALPPESPEVKRSPAPPPPPGALPPETPEVNGSGAYVFDMSVGYDLAGISSPKVSAFLRGMKDATDEIDALRSELTGTWASFADFAFNPRIADTLTLSTFHGCPPEEIESITKYLVDEHQLDVIVKLNPTLLGFETVASTINEDLGYTEVSVKESAFSDDLQFDRGIELIEELNQYAKDRGRVFGIKLTNTLVVDNQKKFMPDDTMYLSGPPLHVLASKLLDRLATALPGRLAIPGHDGDVMVSFSAGITSDNLGDSLAMGVNPTTLCSDLLKPGGYGRLAPMLRTLTKTIAASGHGDLASWKAFRQSQAIEAGFANSCQQHVAHIQGDGKDAYHFSGNEKLPKSVDHDLEMFECVACNFCITVCPNDAFFSIKSLKGMESRQQYLLFTDLCNECGNCMTFCPENGDPAKIKPRLYTDPDLFKGRQGQGYLLANGKIVDARSDQTSRDLVQQLLDTETGNPLATR